MKPFHLFVVAAFASACSSGARFGGKDAAGEPPATASTDASADGLPDAACPPNFTPCCGACLSPNAGICLPCGAGNPDAGVVEKVRFTASYGECIGYCRQSLLIDDNGAQMSFATWTASGPVVDQAVDVEPAVRAEILAAAADTLSEPWQARYGCPDCADQGAYQLDVSVAGMVRTTVLDPYDHPGFFDRVLGLLQPIVAAHRPPSSICTAATPSCVPGAVSVGLRAGTDATLTPTWYNDTDHDIFVAGCTTVEFEQQVSGAWTSAGPAAVCVWEGTARVVPQASAWSDIALGTTGKRGTYRATGVYGIDCTAGVPLSKAACAATLSVTSDAISTAN